MIKSTQLPQDQFGNMLPVACLDSRKTQVLTMAANNIAQASEAFTSKTPKRAKLEIVGSSAGVFTITAVEDSYLAEDISIALSNAGSLGITVVGRAITLAPSGKKFSEIAAVINDNPIINRLLRASYAEADKNDTIAAANVAAAFLKGYDPGDIGCYVRIVLDGDGFYGTFSEAETATKAASIPLSAGEVAWEYVPVGRKISAMGKAGMKAYLTPGKLF